MIMKNVKFDKIRYANVWEDPDMLISNFEVIEGKRVLSIASAGDNCLALLANNPKKVVAVDVSKVQLYLTELKALAVLMLSYEECEAFLGFVDSEDRSSYYSRLRKTLSEDALAYWDANLSAIENGVIHSGKFEKYLRLFSQKVLPLIHNKKRVAELFENKSEDEQKTFYQKKWNTWRWRTLFKVFFSKIVMGRVGRDPEFLKQVEVNVSSFILGQSEDAICSERVIENHILRYCLTGSFQELRPYYMQKENFESIKRNIHKLEYHQGLIHELVESKERFDLFNLSNIFEYMDAPTFQKVATNITKLGNPNAKFGYWNLMVNRSITNVFDQTKHLLVKGIDKGFFYSRFCMDELLISH